MCGDVDAGIRAYDMRVLLGSESGNEDVYTFYSDGDVGVISVRDDDLTKILEELE